MPFLQLAGDGEGNFIAFIPTSLAKYRVRKFILENRKNVLTNVYFI